MENIEVVNMELLDFGLPQKKKRNSNDFGFDMPILDVSFPVDIEGEPPEPTAAQYRKMTKAKIDAVIKKKTKKKKHIIHGARAINKQMTPKFRRKTKDYDLWAGYSASQADQLEDELDKAAGSDMFYERTLTMPDSLHGGIKKVHQVINRKNDEGVADYSKRPPRSEFVNIEGFRFESLAHAKRTKVAILNMDKDWDSPLSEERVKKTRRDLNRIKRYEKSKKKRKKK